MHDLARRHAPADAARGWCWTVWRSLPLSAATFAMSAPFASSLEGTFEERVVRASFWGLAALTLPHVLLYHLDRRAGGGRLT